MSVWSLGILGRRTIASGSARTVRAALFRVQRPQPSVAGRRWRADPRGRRRA